MDRHDPHPKSSHRSRRGPGRCRPGRDPDRCRATGDPRVFSTVSAVSACSPFTGTWVDANPTGGAKITFDQGRISGTDGCNGIGSAYTVTGNVADVDPFLSTMMACTGPWSQWLQGVSTIHHYGAVLVVHGDDGGVLGVLRPAV